MTLTRLIGDIHGAVNDCKAYAIDKFDGPTIQIGDFGIGFGQDEYWLKSVSEFHKLGGHRFIRGMIGGLMLYVMMKSLHRCLMSRTLLSLAC